MSNPNFRIVSLKNKICKRCNVQFPQFSPNQKYCGSVVLKLGCSEINNQEVKKQSALFFKESRRKPDYIPLTNRKCVNYGVTYNANHYLQKYCGSQSGKVGCSWSTSIKTRPRTKKNGRISRLLRLRFLVLQKYQFTCQYCGRKAPEVELQIDHILPKSRGGTNSFGNYTVACADCNVGKGDVILNPV